MVVALLVLSLAMIVAGLLAMILGWDIVLLERGWAMVIAGSVSASGGAILLGLVAVLLRLVRLQEEFAAVGERAPRAAEPPLPPSPVIDPVSLLQKGLLGDGAPRPEGKAPAEPELPLFTPEQEAPREAPPVTLPKDDRPTDIPQAPVIVREDRVVPFAAPAPEKTPLDDIFAGGPPTPDLDPFDDRFTPDWARATRDSETGKADWTKEKAEPAKDKPEPPAPVTPVPTPAQAAGPKPTVIGTYNSGGNRYVMFSDGSIEAETPEGTFKFDSLDELKEFIASGGEAGSNG